MGATIGEGGLGWLQVPPNIYIAHPIITGQQVTKILLKNDSKLPDSFSNFERYYLFIIISKDIFVVNLIKNDEIYNFNLLIKLINIMYTFTCMAV